MSALILRLSGWLLAGCAFATPALAAYDQPEPQETPPEIAARLSIADGDVQIWRTEEDNTGAWDPAEINDVVTASTGLVTGAESRSEVRWGPHALRMGAQTRGGFSRIGYDEAVFNLEYGSVNVRLREDGNDRFAVTAGGLRIDLQSPGRYRVDNRQGQAVRITVFSGRAGLQSAANSLSIAAGQSLDVGPGGSSFAYGTADGTALDEWARRRDEQMQEVRAARYVSPYMTGYEDLDANGDWATDPTYGAVWYPRVVQAGWVPYRYGRWRWISPWGWTWVDDAPWGFAPFHYGRWVVVGGRWCWWPGQRVVRPVYAPALVAWVGRPGWNVSVSVGNPAYVGWYPLAPWNVYEPGYYRDPAYRARINQVVMHVPPSGVRIDVNVNTGRTVVPGAGFREPIRRELPRNPPPMPARDLRPVTAPPPRTGFVPPARDDRGPGARPPVVQPGQPGQRPGQPEPGHRPWQPQPGQPQPGQPRPGQPQPAPQPVQPQPSHPQPAQPSADDGRNKRVPTPRDLRGPVVMEPAPVAVQPAQPAQPTQPAPQRPAPKQPTPMPPSQTSPKAPHGPTPDERPTRVTTPYERGPVAQPPAAPQPQVQMRVPTPPRAEPAAARQEQRQEQKQEQRAEKQEQRAEKRMEKRVERPQGDGEAR